MAVSGKLQVPSPHSGGGRQGPQSVGQVIQVSPLSQVPSPHVRAQGPQSSGHV